jgi:hypothetical protein
MCVYYWCVCLCEEEDERERERERERESDRERERGREGGRDFVFMNMCCNVWGFDIK